MNDLVAKLAKGDHLVSVERYEKLDEFKKAIDRGFVLVKFTETKGGTELGVRLDKSLIDVSAANFTSQEGHVRLNGTLTLNSVKVRCVANVYLQSRKGEGHLEILEQS